MGCFDLYCDVCSGPFTSYKTWDLPNMQHADTTWLSDAIIEYYETKTKVNVCYYDGYGRFEDQQGTEFDVGEKQYDKEVKVYHKLCENRVVDIHTRNKIKSYQQQHFDIDGMIADGNQTLLNKPSS
jgi:hypothetical protein